MHAVQCVCAVEWMTLTGALISTLPEGHMACDINYWWIIN